MSTWHLKNKTWDQYPSKRTDNPGKTVNFTREPIIETIITPKEGYKIVVRKSSGQSQEEYTVDAVEVVSFGKSTFYRSTERPKAFLLPVSDYEIVEAKEVRVALKKPRIEKNIKIAGGKKPAKEEAPVEVVAEETAPEEPAAKTAKTKRGRKRKTSKQKEEVAQEEEKEQPLPPPEAPFRRQLLRPPPGLISDQIKPVEATPQLEKVEETPPSLPPEEEGPDIAPLPFEEDMDVSQPEETSEEETPDLFEKPPESEASGDEYQTDRNATNVGSSLLQSIKNNFF